MYQFALKNPLNEQKGHNKPPHIVSFLQEKYLMGEQNARKKIKFRETRLENLF